MSDAVRLSAALESELIAKWRAGDCVARNRLVVAQLEYVDYWAKRYAVRSAVSYEDLYAEGSLGLAEALDRYDSARGVRLSTYTVQFVRGYMSHLIRKSKQVSAVEELSTFANASDGESDLVSGLQSARQSSRTRRFILDSAHAPDLSEIDSAELATAVCALPRDQRAVIEVMHMGTRSHTLREAARAQGITRAQAERLYAKAIVRLRGYLEAVRG